MNRLSRRPAVLFLFFATLLVLLAVPAALAQSDPCVDSCVRQLDADKAQCDVDLRACYAECDVRTTECQQDPNNQDPISQALCLHEGNICQANCGRMWRRCISIANTTAYNCFRDCQTSPSN